MIKRGPGREHKRMRVVAAEKELRFSRSISRASRTVIAGLGLLLGATSVSAQAPPAAGFMEGRIALTSGGRPLRSEEAVDAVVYYRPDVATAPEVPAKPYEVVTERKTFIPRVLAVPVGATVRFPNRDPILHNVFSTQREASFDLGLYGKGPGASHTFTQPGVIKVYCNVHHPMVAYVLVMDTPFFVRPDAQGRFRLKGLPSGPGELFIWHERAPLWRQRLDQLPAAPVPVTLELSRRKVPPHLNKFGQPYRRSQPGEY
jgi:plastocyanin